MPDAKHILIIEDDPIVADVVALSMEEANYRTTIVNSGQEALNELARETIDLCIVDLGLPDIDGLALTGEIKSRSKAGIIILSGRGETTERIIGLEVGADDYLAKPFEPRELLARVRSVIRRMQPNEPLSPQAQSSDDIYTFEGWQINLTAFEVQDPNGHELHLSNSEFTLLKALIQHPNEVLSRDQLLEFVHEEDGTPTIDRSIDVQITRLRKKMENNPKAPHLIKTIRNRGYIFTPKVIKA